MQIKKIRYARRPFNADPRQCRCRVVGPGKFYSALFQPIRNNIIHISRVHNYPFYRYEMIESTQCSRVEVYYVHKGGWWDILVSNLRIATLLTCLFSKNIVKKQAMH